MANVNQLGETFAGYEIIRSIARGGMGEVYLARNPRLDRQVALKVLAPELLDDPLFRERFTRESQIAASLDHPNVLPVYDAGEEDGVPYIAMRFIDGVDLHHLLDKGPLSVGHAISILAQVAGALHAAHLRGLVHRDVKPGNVLIDKYIGADAAPHVYLSDFGVAKHTISNSGLTSTGHFVGTIDYVAPEQIEGKKVDGRTDIYALGCVLYECLTGRKPFVRDTHVAVIYAHLIDPPPVPSHVRPEVPRALDEIVAKAMAKSPDDRYATAGELGAAGRAALSRSRPAATVDAKRVSTTVPSPRPEPRSTVPAQKPAPRTATATMESQSGSSRAWRWLLAGALLLVLAAGGFLAIRGLSGSGRDGSEPRPQTQPTGNPVRPPGAVRIAVPSVVGNKRRQAVARLRALELRPSVVVRHTLAKKGTVYSQTPGVGKRLAKGARVRLLVSLGPLPVIPGTSVPVTPVPAPPPPVGGGGGGGGQGGGGGGG